MHTPSNPEKFMFEGRIFTVSEARAHGFTVKQLRHPRLARPFHGVRVVRGPRQVGSGAPESETNETLRLAHAFTPLLAEGAAFSHASALVLYGCPIRSPRVLHVCVPHPQTPPRHAGVSGHRYRSAMRTRRTADGLIVVEPGLAVAQAAQTLALPDVVVAIDHLIRPLSRGSPPLVTHELLGRSLRACSLTGVVRAREAWRLSRVDAESRMETLLRLKLEGEGIHDLELQVDIHDERGFIGRFDLVDRLRRTIYEYDGEQHRTNRAQYLRDVERLERARAAGWRVVRFHHEDIFSGRERFRRALQRGSVGPRVEELPT